METEKSRQKRIEAKKKLTKEKRALKMKIYRRDKKIYEGKVSSRQIKKIEREKLLLQKKVSKIEVKSFKYSEKYVNLKQSRQKLKNRNRYLISSIKKGEVYNKKTHSWEPIDNTAALNISKEISRNNEEIIGLNVIMDLPVRDINQGGIVMELPDLQGQDTDEVTHWEFEKEIKSNIDTGRFKKVKIYNPFSNDSEFKSTDWLAISLAISLLINEVSNYRSQHRLRTPVYTLVLDYDESTLSAYWNQQGTGPK